MSDAVTKRTSAEIREDIGRTRLGLDFLVDALEGRLSMGSLIDEAMGNHVGGPRHFVHADGTEDVAEPLPEGESLSDGL